MSLSAGEQRVLDGIAEVLRASEPRLASMFAIFGRLFKNDGPPLRERLPATRPIARLARLRRRLTASMRGSSVTGSRVTGSGMTGSRVTGSRSRGTGIRGSRRVWQLVFVFANVVAAVVLLALVISLNTHSARDCSQRPLPSAPVYVFRGGDCSAQAGSGGAPQR